MRIRRLLAPAAPPRRRALDHRSRGRPHRRIPFRFQITAWADSPRLDCRAEFEFESQKIGELSDNRREAHAPFVHERKLRFKLFPTAGPGATGIHDVPFAVAETPDR